MKVKVFAIIGVVVLLITVLVGVLYMRQQQDIRSKAAPASTLAFSPSTASKKQGDSFTLDVVVNTGANTISAADLVINTDATKVKITGITPGNYLTTVLMAQTHTDSRASVTLGSSPTSPKQGTGTLATVTFQIVAASGNAQITLNGSQVAGIGESGNVLTGSTPASITISAGGGSGNGSSTPTRTPTRTPTPTQQTGGAQVTLTPTPTTAPQSTATATPTPTNTPGSSQVSISNPTEGETFDATTPTFTGTAPADSSVTITIYSEPITAVVVADSGGGWTYTPTESLSEGQHQITALVLASDGTTSTVSKSFYVITSEVPVTAGGIESLFLPVGTGILLLLLGFFL